LVVVVAVAVGVVLTLSELRKILAAVIVPEPSMVTYPWEIGGPYFIRTVTMHYTGKLVQVYAGELVLEDTAWIADSGRFHEALMKGTLNEVEPFPAGKVIVSRYSVIDVSVWTHDLPRVPK